MQPYNEDTGSHSILEQPLNQGSATLSQRRSDYLILERGVLQDVVDQNGNPVDFVTFLISDSSIPYRSKLVKRALETGQTYEKDDNTRGEYRFYTERVSAVLPRIGITTTLSRPGINNSWLDEQMNKDMDRFHTYQELRKHREDVLYRLAGVTQREPEYEEPLRIKERKKTLVAPKDNLQGMKTADLVDYMERVFPALWK